MYFVRKAAFEQMVATAFDSIPPQLAQTIDNVALFVEDEDPDDPGLMGYYEGTDTSERSGFYSGDMPDRIVVFRLPHCRSAESAEDVAAEVRVTVLHEIAHYFGITDEALHEMDRY